MYQFWFNLRSIYCSIKHFEILNSGFIFYRLW
jgi:hypothetical protein